MNADTTTNVGRPLLRPIDIKRQGRVPYRTVIAWLEAGHPRAGVLPSVNLAATGKRKSYRIRPEDWESVPVAARDRAAGAAAGLADAAPVVRSQGEGPFRY